MWGKNALHINQILEENHKVTTEWDGTRYIEKSLKQFNHTKKKKKTSPTQAHLSYMGPKKMQRNHPQLNFLTKR